MTGTPAVRRTMSVLEITPVALVVAAEGAWVSVVGGFIQVVRLQTAILGIPILIAFVVGGLVAARTLGPRLGPRWAVVGLGLCVAAGAIGWLASPSARDALLAGDLARAVGRNPGGWVAGLAVLRGFADARPVTDSTPARMLRLGIPGLALLAVLAGAVVEPWRGAFLAETLIAAVVFIACGTLALAFARQRAVSADLPVDWRRNRSWLVLLVGAVLIATGLALALAGVIGEAILILIALAMGPLVIIGLVFGTDRRTVRVIGIGMAVALFGYLLVLALANGPAAPPPVDDPTAIPSPPETDPGVIVGLGGIGVVLALIVALILIRLWMRPVTPIEADPTEVRTIDRGDDPSQRIRGRRRRRHGTPTDALSAYLALIDDVAGRDDARREPAETPFEHARRLRRDGAGELGLDLLAADVALASFAGVALSPREDRRAVGRWRRLRSSLGRS